jgi:hypothetical protein
VIQGCNDSFHFSDGILQEWNLITRDVNYWLEERKLDESDDDSDENESDDSETGSFFSWETEASDNEEESCMIIHAGGHSENATIVEPLDNGVGN